MQVLGAKGSVLVPDKAVQDALKAVYRRTHEDIVNRVSPLWRAFFDAQEYVDGVYPQ